MQSGTALRPAPSNDVMGVQLNRRHIPLTLAAAIAEALVGDDDGLALVFAKAPPHALLTKNTLMNLHDLAAAFHLLSRPPQRIVTPRDRANAALATDLRRIVPSYCLAPRN